MATVSFNYSIFMSDPVLVAQYQAQYPNGVTGISPTQAATLFSATLNPPSYPTSGPFIVTGGLSNGTAGLTLTNSSVIIPANFTIDAFGNLFASAGAPQTTLQWCGFFLMYGGTQVTTAEALQTHRWLVGFEMPNQGEGEASGSATQRQMRDASRANWGTGLALRSPANDFISMTMPVTSKYSWERFYIRVRTLPTANEMFWGAVGSVEAGTAVHLDLTPSGQIALYNKGNQVWPGTLAATGGTIKRNVWTRVDIIVSFATTSASNGDGNIIVYLNGVEAVRRQYPFAAGGGGGLFASAANHASSRIGNENTPSTGLEIDVDDWTNKTQPTLYNGLDWRNGTHISRLRITGFDTAGQGGWSGSYQTLDGVPVVGQTDVMSSTTSSDQLKVLTDITNISGAILGASVAAFFKTAAGVAGSIGYSLNGGAYVNTGITATSGAWTVPVIYSLGGTVNPPALTQLGIDYIRNASVVQQDLQVLQIEVEFPYFMGPEDGGPWMGDAVSEAIPHTGPHNSPYEAQPYLVSSLQPTFAAPVEVMAGTYVGNGTGQDIDVQMPAHWIWIRPTSVVGNGGARWWSSMLAGHDPLPQTPVKGNLVRCYFDSANNTYKFRISGGAANNNQNGITYQYVAFSDPGMRFSNNGANLTANAAASVTANLPDASFTPNAVFLWAEAGGVSATTGVYYKGPGHATTAASAMDAAESATICAMQTGSLTPKATINLASSQLAYSAWRTSDGTYSGPVAITNYTGDGTGARTISLALGGRSPIFALVVPHNGASIYRDPSHTGSNSQLVNSSGTTVNGITGGDANQITVASALNALGVVYDVFVLAGTVQAGWSPNPASPIVTAPTTTPASGPYQPSPNGWWQSTNKFTGNATVLTYPPSNPHDGRDWSKIGVFAAGNAAYYGGFPGPACVFDNDFLIYAGNDYAQGGTQPTIRVFDGLSDRLMITIPDVAGVKALAIMAMLPVGNQIYLTTLDSGTSASTWAGRVFQFDPIGLQLTQLGSQFTSGDVPYALCWHMGRLFMGTNRGNGSNTGRVLWFRPGIDSAWTQDFTLTTLATGGVLSMASYKGLLYVGTDNDAAHATGKILVRDTAGAYTVSFTATVTGTARVNNGFPSLIVFNDKLYAGYWNPDSAVTNQSYIMRFDNTSWVTAYNGAAGTIRPYISMFIAQNTLFVLGGGSGLSAMLLSTPNGATFTDLSGFLTNNVNVTSTPLIGVLGV